MDDKNEDLCQFCFDKVTFLCLSCKTRLCGNCVSVHIKMKPRDSHKIVVANEKSQVKTKQLKVLGKISSGMESLCDISYKENGTFYSCSEISKSISLLDDSGLTRDTFEGCKNPFVLQRVQTVCCIQNLGLKRSCLILKDEPSIYFLQEIGNHREYPCPNQATSC